MPLPTLLGAIDQVDNFTTCSGGYEPFHLTKLDGLTEGIKPLGWITPKMSFIIKNYMTDESPVWRERDGEGKGYWCVREWVLEQGRRGISTEMGKLVTWMRDKQDSMLKPALDGWRNERYMIYADPSSSYFTLPSAHSTPINDRSDPRSPIFGNHVFSLERAACALFGLMTYGVHMTVYEGEGQDMKIWVPTRSATKATWPGKLDNSVAGGIPEGMTNFECLVKEADEEASLPESLTRKYAKAVGSCTYFYVTPEGFLQPECEYVYDMKMPPRSSPEYTTLRPHDSEVESFSLIPISQILHTLRHTPTLFKPNCGLILVDFLLRHGLVTAEEDPCFWELGWRARRRLGFAMPVAGEVGR